MLVKVPQQTIHTRVCVAGDVIVALADSVEAGKAHHLLCMSWRTREAGGLIQSESNSRGGGGQLLEVLL